MDAWDMCCAFLHRIMTFGDNPIPSQDECSNYSKLESEIIKAYNDHIMDFRSYDIVLRFYRLVKRRKCDLFVNDPPESFL